MVNKNKKDKQTIIEISADYIYLVIIGKKENLKQFINNIKYYKDDNKQFIISRLDIPILFSFDKIKKNYTNIQLLDRSIESAQSYAFAQEQFIFPKMNRKLLEEDKSINHMIMLIDNNILRFPKIDLNEEDPEKVIFDWLKKYCGFVNEEIKKTIRPLSLVGYNNEILVYSAKI
jgi:hypothetical protein